MAAGGSTLRDESVESALRKYVQGLNVPKKVAMRQLPEDMPDEIMKGEREVFLGRDIENKGNGYYPRELSTGSWNG